jgi:hypothetical protein
MRENYRYGWVCNAVGAALLVMQLPLAALPVFGAALYFFLVTRE